MTKRSFQERLAPRLLRWAVQYALRQGRTYVTYHERPKRAAQIGTWPEQGAPATDCSIVMQGPVATQDDFTRETMILYARSFPGCKLILSTWADTPEALLDPIRRLGVQIVLSEKPQIAGLFNVNMQLVSAGAGVRAAVADGTEWILKTRTDQRLYNPDAMAYLIALAQAFPVGPGVQQRHRIIGVGHGSLKFAPYHLTDQSVFGHAQDMLTYWTAPLVVTPPPAHWPTHLLDIYVQTPIGELCRYASAESYLTSSFLLSTGRTLDWTLSDSWAAYRDHFCFADYSTTDFYWVKQQSQTLREFPHMYDHVSNRQEFTFREWLLMHNGTLKPESAHRYQGVLATRFNAPVEPSAPATDLPP
jgi:hypothetical protein